MTYNAAQVKQVRKLEKLAAQAKERHDEVIKNIMSTTAGRAWMFDRLSTCHIFDSSFSNDSLRMAFAEGERNIGLKDLAHIVTICPDLYLLMQQEAKQQESVTTVREESEQDELDFGPTEVIGDE